MNTMNAHANLHKRKSSLIADGTNHAAFKTSRKGTYVDSLERKDDAIADNDNNEEKAGEEDDASDEENKPSTRCFSHGYHLMEGEMNHGMEDYVFAQHKKLNDYDLGLYAIFDGHSGRDVAKYLQNHLFENILNEPDFWENPVHAVKKASKTTDEEILENIADWRGGSTAVAAILINGVKLIVINVGDSRAISCKNGNVARVDGELAMTRAFGDGKLKEHITAEPDVMIKKIDDDTEFIILASDGLWKVMTNQEACDCIKDVDDAQKAAKKLVKEAKSMGSYDDISCIVVMF